MSVFFQKATGAAAIAETVTPSGPFALDSISLHLSAAGAAGTLTVTLDAYAGSVYDLLLYSQDMTSVTDLLWQPERPIELESGDKIVIAWTNASTRTYGLITRWLGR
jgi:hypothetical protein